MMAPGMSRTAELRAAIGRLRASAALGGEFLPGALSLAIYAEAAAAFRCCDACTGLEGMCFRANKQDDFWPVFDKAHGASSTSAAGATLPVALRATVHAVANQLPRVTSTWRTRAVEGLRTVAGLEDLAEEQLQSALHEVVQLSTAAVQAAIFFEMAGLEDDWDPSSEVPDNSPPPRRRLSELFNHVNPPDGNIWCEFVLAKDGLKDGATDRWKHISPEQARSCYSDLNSPVVPHRSWSTNPKALCDWICEMPVFYMPLSQVQNLFNVGRQPGRALNRPQMEIVAGKTAEGLNCDF
eukprot:jgi/Tetstr1/438022/TSEL_026649.t1